VADFPFFSDATFINDIGLPNVGLTLATIGDPTNALYPIDFACHHNGKRQVTGRTVDGNDTRFRTYGCTKMNFIIPIYSGVIGLMMPEKRLLPLNLLPLDIEIVFNPTALYSNLVDGSRSYTITSFNLYANMFFFEQEIHRTLEASVADHGLFIYCNSFHSAP
jgi:hypothetical protein